MGYTSIRPGQVWLDTEGKRIQAHAGSVFFENDTFYWYGENKEKTVPGNGILHWGMRCYSSQDLYNWRDEGLMIPPDLENERSPLHPSAKAERPHVLKNPHTGKYVCWLKVIGKDGSQTETVLVADRLMGPYTLVESGLRPLGMNAGDFDLVQAGDGKGYYYFERVHSELICADLTDSYTGVTGYYTTHFPKPSPPDVREAPAYFTRGHKHYLLTSGTTGYHPNPSEAAIADTFHGPWSEIGDLHPEDASRTSYGSQISAVFRHPGKRDLYIAMGDRWMPGLRNMNPAAYDGGETYRDAAEQFRRTFSLDAAERAEAAADWRIPKANTSLADYVWLPITFEGERPIIRWQTEWRIEDYD